MLEAGADRYCGEHELSFPTSSLLV